MYISWKSTLLVNVIKSYKVISTCWTCTHSIHYTDKSKGYSFTGHLFEKKDLIFIRSEDFALLF